MAHFEGKVNSLQPNAITIAIGGFQGQKALFAITMVVRCNKCSQRGTPNHNSKDGERNKGYNKISQ